MSYRLRVWCGDCRDADPQGCFDGSYDDREETYETVEAASDAGWVFVGRAPYEFEVLDAEGKPLDPPVRS